MCQNNFRNLEENSQFKNNLGMEMLNIKDQQINELLSSIYDKTHDLLDNNQSKIIKLKDLLLEKETIYEKDIDLILA
jgi:ATP-dependent Zn protease